MAESDNFDNSLRTAFEPAYVIEHEITGGGMSRVFLATEQALNRKVVIKVLPSDLAAGVNRERFRREVQLAAQLQHPHIVPLYSAGERGDLLFYTMPFIEGESLKHAIHEGTKFSPREVVGILHDVVDALAYAHARGVIHRDIKPGNVLRSGRHAVVTDFGVAKAISASLPAVGTTTSGMAIGTPAYMAPEQLAGDPAADHRMDIYAVGLLAYELLTGEAPFSEPSPQETMAAQLTRAPQPIARTRSDVPPALTSLVMQCLAKNPDQRPSSAAELLASLDALAFPSGDFLPAPAPRRRGTLLLAAAILAALVLVFLRRERSPTAATTARTTSAAPAAPPAVPAAGAATGPAGTAGVGPALTRQDSLAITKKVEAQMAARQTKAAEQQSKVDRAAMAAFADSLRASFEKAIFDSLAKIRAATPVVTAPALPPGVREGRGGLSNERLLAFQDSLRRSLVGAGYTKAVTDSIVAAARTTAMTFRFDGRGMPRGRPGQPDRAALDARAADPGPARRVVVANPPPDRQAWMQVSGTAITDALRGGVASKRFVPVSGDSTQAVLARTRNRDSVMTLLNADMLVSIRGQLVRSDSVYWVVTVRDPTAHSQYTGRTVVSPRAPVATPLLYQDSLVAQTIRALTEMDRAPRRGAEDPGARGPPGTPGSAAAPPTGVKKPQSRE
ncbi:MAG: serine/threonine-protein kinase [Gemmatimonadales bacterium]